MTLDCHSKRRNCTLLDQFPLGFVMSAYSCGVSISYIAYSTYLSGFIFIRDEV